MTAEQIISIISYQNIYAEFLDNIYAGDAELTMHKALVDFYESTVLSDYASEDDEKVYALMEHTDESYEQCAKYIDDMDYRVLTDSEADEAWDESLQNYLDDCVLPDLPESMRRYFDEESWIEDAKMDGRGNSLSSYDGNEYAESINSTTYYIYQC